MEDVKARRSHLHLFLDLRDGLRSRSLYLCVVTDCL